MMKVKLIYFKENGKYYTDAIYTTKLNDLYSIWQEVRKMRTLGTLPGLEKDDDGHEKFIVSVDAPECLHNHPHLII